MLGQMDVMDHTGHFTVRWDSDKEHEVEAAEAQYDALVGKGYQAFALEGEDKRGRRLDAFDAEVEAMIMVPQHRGG